MPKDVKGTPAWLLALGEEPPPGEIELEKGRFRLEHVFKHDFFAFTGLYRAAAQDGAVEANGSGRPERVVLKIGRRASCFALPLSWVGRLHAWHESSVFGLVQDLPIVPAFTGRYGAHGLTHAFVEGRALERGASVPDDFFERLATGLAEFHQRGLAYVDLEKPENVLLGADGRPYLFDFQISYRWPFARGGESWPARWLRARLQQGDRYHLQKLRRRFRPDQMTEEELAASKRRPRAVRLYARATRPITLLRRRVLNRLDPVKKRGERGSQPQASSGPSR